MKSMPYGIIRANYADVDDIMKIEKDCFAPDVRESRSTFLERLSAFPEGFLILSPGPVGYLSSELWDTEPSAENGRWALGHSAEKSHTPDGSVLYVSSLAVVPAARGGAGRFLFNEGIARIHASHPTIRRVVFIVHENWRAARHIYESEGFTYTGAIPGFFASTTDTGKPSDALIMGKNL